jgi:hypothetical protein
MQALLSANSRYQAPPCVLPALQFTLRLVSHMRLTRGVDLVPAARPRCARWDQGVQLIKEDDGGGAPAGLQYQSSTSAVPHRTGSAVACQSEAGHRQSSFSQANNP